MKTIFTLNKGLLCTLFLASMMLFSLSVEAQTSFVKPGKTGTSNNNSKSTNSKAANTAKGSTQLGNINNSKAARSIDSRMKVSKQQFALLSMSENGLIMLDLGEGAEILKNDEDKPFTSIIAALNYLIGDQKWRLTNSYNLTNESPFPSFLLSKIITAG